MSGLSGRRGRMLGSEPISTEHAIVHAEVPATELAHYSTQLRSLTSGHRQLPPLLRPLRAGAPHLVEQLGAEHPTR